MSVRHLCWLWGFIIYLALSLTPALAHDPVKTPQPAPESGGFQISTQVFSSAQSEERVDFFPKDYEFARRLADQHVSDTFDHLREQIRLASEKNPESRIFGSENVDKAELVARQLMQLLGKLMSESDSLYEQLQRELGFQEAEKEYAKRVQAGKISVEIVGLGQAELNTVDGQRFIKVTHAPTETSILILNDETTLEKSRHLRQIVARQHLDSGQNRPDGQKGRDVISVWANQEEGLKKVTISERPSTVRHYLADYYYATVETPNAKRIFWQGFVFGGIQFFVASGMAELSSHFSGMPHSYHAPILALIYGTVIGGFNSTYRQWLYRGSSTRFFMKSMALSMSFSYILRFWMGATIDPFSLGLVTHLGIFANALINGYARTHFSAIPKIRQLLRKSSHPIQVGRWNTGIPWASVEGQGSYLAQFAFKIPGVLPGMEIFGNLIFLAASDVVRRVNLWYAEHIGFVGKKGQMDSAEQMRAKWDDHIRGGFVRRWLASPFSSSGNRCGKLLMAEF